MTLPSGSTVTRTRRAAGSGGSGSRRRPSAPECSRVPVGGPAAGGSGIMACDALDPCAAPARRQHAVHRVRNGVRQQEGSDFRVEGGVLIFDPELVKEGRLGFWRWFWGAWGSGPIARTTRSTSPGSSRSPPSRTRAGYRAARQTGARRFVARRRRPLGRVSTPGSSGGDLRASCRSSGCSSVRRRSRVSCPCATRRGREPLAGGQPREAAAAPRAVRRPGERPVERPSSSSEDGASAGIRAPGSSSRIACVARLPCISGIDRSTAVTSGCSSAQLAHAAAQQACGRGRAAGAFATERGPRLELAYAGTAPRQGAIAAARSGSRASPGSG